MHFHTRSIKFNLFKINSSNFDLISDIVLVMMSNIAQLINSSILFVRYYTFEYIK